MWGLISTLGLGFVLGIKHAIEPDHVIAVSTIASENKNLWKSSLTGVFWGIGHTATLFILGVIIIKLKGEIPEMWAMSLEFLVGLMLVAFGISAMLSYKKILIHHKKNVSYIKSVIMGLIHGLAGSAAMVLLTMSTTNSLWEGALYILVFGAGTVVGMLLFTTVIGIPIVLSASKVRINRTLAQLAGLVSTAFGLYYIYNLGVTEGLFKLWTQ